MSSLIDWEKLTRDIGLPEGKCPGTSDAQHALEMLLGEENLCAAVDCMLDLTPGWELAEKVLKIVQSQIVVRYLYDVYKSEAPIARRQAAVFFLAALGETQNFMWVEEFLNDPDASIQWNGFVLLENLLLYKQLPFEECEQMITKAEQNPELRVRERAGSLRTRMSQR